MKRSGQAHCDALVTLFCLASDKTVMEPVTQTSELGAKTEIFATLSQEELTGKMGLFLTHHTDEVGQECGVTGLEENGIPGQCSSLCPTEMPPA